MSNALWLHDKRSDRLERETMGSTPFADVPPSPYYIPSPGSFLSTRSWLDEDDLHVVAAHDCLSSREVHVLPWPTWQAASDGSVTPSYSCDRCGVHTFLSVAWERAARPTPDEKPEQEDEQR